MSEAPDTLVDRYSPADLAVLTPTERDRFFRDVDPADVEAAPDDPNAWRRVGRAVGWHLLYRLEPDVYERLVTGERIHQGIWDVLPDRVQVGVEVGAGTGRFTVDLASRCERLVAVEPAGPLRDILRERVPPHVEIVDGFLDAIPMPDASADIVAACSSFTAAESHGGEAGLAEMERVARPGGLVAIVWPPEPEWLIARGYAHHSFDGNATVEFGSTEEARELARIFYPDAVDAIDGPRVPFEVLGMRPPNDVCLKRMPA